MTLRLSDEVAAQIRDALIAALRASGLDHDEEDESVLGRTPEQEDQLRDAIRLLDEQQETAALEKALLATPVHLLANLEEALGLALAHARDRICTDPSKTDLDSSQAQALKQLEKLHTEVRRIMTIPPP